jgi:hypothetical protein
MLQTLFSRSRPPRHEDEEQDLPSAEIHYLPGADPGLPLIVAKVEQEGRARVALKRMGYLEARLAYRRQKRAGEDTFHAFEAEHLWPTMDFVQEWLREERREIVARHRSVFLLSMLATILAGLAFLGALALLG